MTVGEILSLAAALAGKEELSRAFAEGKENPSDDDVKKFLCAYDLTVGELCEEVCPLVKEKTLFSADGKFYYTAFGDKVTDVLSAEAEGKKIGFKKRLDFVFAAAGEVTFTYVYAPKEATDTSEECVIDGKSVSKRVLAKGVASEYLLTVGAFEEATFLRKAFEESVGKMILKKKIKKLKGRIWV